MHIKKLEISGFKSFVDKTVVHFDHDVIGIVGPNGCGKSNIVDSIRWCMGEQSAKHLRGKAMEDVIFNGSESRPPAGLAEVTITFDNSDPEQAAALPIEYRDYAEVAVTRRLFRDGTSEYLINKAQVRLRDVTELFLGTGVGTKAYSIVEQGRIGQIVSARAEDRRLFIEEAAGITKYKQRRKQAERKMELTRTNLLRINDIVSEIERNRNTLKRQVAKAERFLSYRAELEDLSLHDASHQLLELIVTEQVERNALNAANAIAGDARHQLDAAEATVEQARAEAKAIEQRADESGRLALEADNQVAVLTAEFDKGQERLHHLDERLRTGDEELDLIATRLERLHGEREELEARVQELESTQTTRTADAASEDEALEALRQEERQASDSLTELKGKRAELEQENAATGARIDAVVQRLAETRQRADQLATDREQLDGELTTLAARETSLAAGVGALESGKTTTAEEKARVEAQLGTVQGELADSGRALESVRQQLGLKRSRLRALEDLHRRLEGVGAGPKALLSRAGEKDGGSGVIGMVADHVEAPEALTGALAGLLGDRLQYVIVTDLRQGVELLEELKASGKGRAHVVPQRPPVVAGTAPRNGLVRLNGDAGGLGAYGLPPALAAKVRGPILDELRYAPEDELLLRSLVGDAILVEDAVTAVELVQRRRGTTAVTLDGTVVRPDGVISGGVGDDVAAAMVEQKRELRVLAEEVAKLTTDEAELAAIHNEHRARKSTLDAALERAKQEAHEGELALMTARKDLDGTQQERRRAADHRARLEQELVELEQRLQQAAAQEVAARARLGEVQGQLEHLGHEIVRRDGQVASWREKVAAQQSLVTDRKIRLAQIKEQFESARSGFERVARAIEELDERTTRVQSEGLESARAHGDTAARMVLAREARIEAAATAATAHADLDEARGLLEQVRHALATRDEELKALRSSQSDAEEASRRHEMALQRIDLERDHLLGKVAEKFRGLDLRRIVGDYHARPIPTAEQRRRITELTGLIDRMGPVNLDAQAEYEEAEKRFSDLSGQKIDIEQALEELDRAILHMDRESRKRFKETFDHINELFKASFVRLFRGGRGELKLTNPDDLLTSGVEIIAMPPGKRLGNIELMSGGEKALTAVALIFAIFQHKPSPFCILDEVDAPLDEANVGRYNDAIRSMTDRSQFILITHIKKTMQSVDVLYGVTMGEPGVSRLVSVKVNDAAVNRGHRVREEASAAAPAQVVASEAAGETNVA